MRPVIPYLTFPGTCRQAMAFYATTLGGDVTIMTPYADAPVEVPQARDDQVFNSEIRAGDFVLKASDGPASAMSPTIALFLTLDDEAAMRSVLDRLSSGGRVLFPADDTFGMVEDRFGVRWMATHAVV